MAGCSSKLKLSETKFHNWIKSGLAIKYTGDGLRSFIFDEIRTFQQKTYDDLLIALKLAKDTKCAACSTESIVCDNCKRRRCVSLHRECPKDGLCNQFKDKIIKAHRYHGPSWANTDTKKWSSDPWQVAKCYMPKEGYTFQMTPEDTDFNGTISVILNHENFSRRLSANLTDRDNIFRKAQNVSKAFRHTASFEVEDDDFQANLAILTEVLQEKEIAEYQEAKDALKKLLELCDSHWSIFTSNDDIFSVMKTACETEKMEPETNEGKEKLEMLKLAMEVIEANTTANTKSLVLQMQSSFNKYQDDQIKKSKRKDMRRNLIKTYELEYSTLPISALFEEEDAPLLSFYVSPVMQQVEYHRIRKKCTTVKSYYDIFHKDGQPCRNIYITGDAGTGKTAVCQRMVLCWCHAHSDGIADDNFSQEDIDAMKSFEFLFCVSLRDTEVCHIESMIQQQLLVADKTEMIDQIFEEENCLIILDGLDEWTHPKSATFCPKNKKIPHRKVRDNCVYVTTSRPWKLEADRLKITEIDQQIELKGLDKKASDKLTACIVKHLNEKYLEDRSPEDFQNTVEKKKQVENVSRIPIIKIQLISLWFKDTSICTNFSRCSIYADTLEMLFLRVNERKERQQTVSQMDDIVKVFKSMTQSDRKIPDCISELTCLQEYSPMLFKIGHLAFDMLFTTPDGESALVFKRNVGREYDLPDNEMELLLSIGILSKNKVIGPYSERLIKLSFLHKSYQEYMAALYITMNKDYTNNVKQVFSKCKSLPEFLKYEQMFVFLSGMCVEVMEKISVEVREMVSTDESVVEYRGSANYKFGLVMFLKPYNTVAAEQLEQAKNGEGALRALQALMLHCLEESFSCKNKDIVLPITDIFIGEEYGSDLKQLLERNKDYIRSVNTETYIGDFASFKMLEKLVVKENTYPETNIDDIEKYMIIASTTACLKSLSLANCKGRLSPFTSKIKTLTALGLYDVVLEHNEMLEVFKFISKSVALIQLFLCDIKCSEHVAECSGTTLNLCNHSELKYLRLQKLYDHAAHEIRLNHDKLQLLVLENSSKLLVVKSVIQDLQNAPELTELDLIGFKTPILIDIIISTLPTLRSLKRLSLVDVDFGDRILEMKTEDAQPIEIINFLHTTLSFKSFCRFVDSLPKQTVMVNMQVCRLTCEDDEGTQEKDFTEVADYVRANEAFEVTVCGRGRLDFNSKY